jgi:hypothetical protein
MLLRRSKSAARRHTSRQLLTKPQQPQRTAHLTNAAGLAGAAASGGQLRRGAGIGAGTGLSDGGEEEVVACLQGSPCRGTAVQQQQSRSQDVSGVVARHRWSRDGGGAAHATPDTRSGKERVHAPCICISPPGGLRGGERPRAHQQQNCQDAHRCRLHVAGMGDAGVLSNSNNGKENRRGSGHSLVHRGNRPRILIRSSRCFRCSLYDHGIKQTTGTGEILTARAQDQAPLRRCS